MNQVYTMGGNQVGGYIERKSLLRPSAVEWGDWGLNLCQGCAHGCNYPCYAFLDAKRFGRAHSYEEWCRPLLVSNFKEILEKEIPKYKNKIKTVNMSYSTDPFMYQYPEVIRQSLEAIAMLNAEGIGVTALTKGILPYPLGYMSYSNVYGISLVSLSEKFRAYMEPGAAPISLRLASLKALADKGFTTFISMEPYPHEGIIKQDLMEILETVSFVDKIIFGKTNHSKEASMYPGYKEFVDYNARIVMEFCRGRGIECLIKKGTLMNDENS